MNMDMYIPLSTSARSLSQIQISINAREQGSIPSPSL
jgi:hypothetical protein